MTTDKSNSDWLLQSYHTTALASEEAVQFMFSVYSCHVWQPLVLVDIAKFSLIRDSLYIYLSF